MSARAARAALRAVCVAVALGGCAARTITSRAPVAGAPAPGRGASGGASSGLAGADTARGVLRVAGPMPGTLVLERGGRGAPLALDDQPRDPALRAADGLEVMVRGTLQPALGRFVVAGFVVRAVDGVAALDGVLERDATGLWLRPADGRRERLVAPPAAFAGAVGARVYWAGPRDRPPVAYGFLSR